MTVVPDATRVTTSTPAIDSTGTPDPGAGGGIADCSTAIERTAAARPSPATLTRYTL